MKLSTKSLRTGVSNGCQLQLIPDGQSARFLSTVAENLQNFDFGFTSLRERDSHVVATGMSSKIVFDPYVEVCSVVFHNEILPHLAEIYSQVECRLVPSCCVESDGTVFIGVRDISHLGQIDQFLMSKCFGPMAMFVEDKISAEFFESHIAIGKYKGEDRDGFVEKATYVLRRLCEMTPSVVVFDIIELIVADKHQQHAHAASAIGAVEVSGSIIQYVLSG